MPAKKTGKPPPPSDQFGIRIDEAERAYLREAAQRLSDQSPTKIGLGPFLIWAAKREAEKLLGISYAEYGAREAKRGKGGAR